MLKYLASGFMENNNCNKIKKIETKTINKNPDWFYHGCDFGNIPNILKDGILAKKYLDYPCPNFGLNGKYYISVAKDTNLSDNALDQYKYKGPLVVMDNLKVIKCKESKLYKLFINTQIPLRYTVWSDEYQVFSKITPDKIIAIECMAYEWTKHGNILMLKRLRKMIEVMNSLNSKLPIYDYSREENGIVHELDKEAYLKLIPQNPYDLRIL